VRTRPDQAAPAGTTADAPDAAGNPAHLPTSSGPGYTREVPAAQIAQNLAFINWTVLTGLALGTFAAVVLLRRRSEVTRGFLGFTTICAIAFGVLAWLSDGALPTDLGESPVAADATWAVPRTTALAAFWVVALAGLIVRRFRSTWAPAIDLAALSAGALTLIFGALTWGGGDVGTVALFVQLSVLGAATGGVFAAMILGHWYLVTPKLPEAPLIMLARLLLAIIALQVVLFAFWIATGAGPAHAAPFAALGGPWALFVWLRLIIGLIFPLIVSWAAVQTARSRSMESATGLLYINVGTIAAGTILAAGLYFGAGLLV
jgi:hypothetical protein